MSWETIKCAFFRVHFRSITWTLRKFRSVKMIRSLLGFLVCAKGEFCGESLARCIGQSNGSVKDYEKCYETRKTCKVNGTFRRCVSVKNYNEPTFKAHFKGHSILFMESGFLRKIAQIWFIPKKSHNLTYVNLSLLTKLYLWETFFRILRNLETKIAEIFFINVFR